MRELSLVGGAGRRIHLPTHVAVTLMLGCLLLASYAATLTA